MNSEIVLGFLRIVVKNGNGQSHAAADSGQVVLFKNTSSRTKFKEDCSLCDLMRQEHVTIKNVQVERLFELIKKHMQELELDIIHEEKAENYWDLKAHKGSKGSAFVGNIRDVEIMISGTKDNYDLVLRTGAWGKDILVPAIWTGVVTAGVATIPVALAEIYRSHAFEKHFWDFIREKTAEVSEGGKAEMSSPVTVTP